MTAYALSAGGVWSPSRPAIIRPLDEGLEWLRKQRRKLRMNFEGQWFPKQAIQFVGGPHAVSQGRAFNYLGTSDSSDGTSGSTRTLSSLSFGPAAADRYIVAAVGVSDNASTITDVSAVIGGVSASMFLKTGFSAVATIYGIAFAIANVPTGTTGSIAITCVGAANMDYAVAAWWNVYGLSSMTPVATYGDTTNPLSGSLAGTVGGVSLGFGVSHTSGTSFTWSGLSENSDQSSHGIARVSASSLQVASTPITVTATPATFTSGRMISASWF